MKRFELTLMCAACKWRITEELEKHGYSHFDIDMDTSVLTFEEDVYPDRVIRVVNDIGYKIEKLPEKDELSDEEIALLEDALRNGYTL